MIKYQLFSPSPPPSPIMGEGVFLLFTALTLNLLHSRLNLYPFSLREIWTKILGYYAKKEPERARKADALCREIVKQSQIR